MKKIHLLSAVVCAAAVSYLIPRVSFGEKSQRLASTFHQPLTPEATLRAFVNDYNTGNVRHASTFILGAHPSVDLNSLELVMKKSQGLLKVLLNGTRCSTQIKGETATLQLSGFVLDMDFNRGRGTAQRMQGVPATRTMAAAETLNLKRKDGRWKFVVGGIERLTAPKTYLPSDTMEYLLLSIKFPQVAAGGGDRAGCQSALRQWWTGCALALQDNDGIYHWGQSSFRRQVETYVRTSKAPSCPRVAVGTPSYAFNEKLEGLKESTVKLPYRTILFYEGKGEKFSFRHVVYNRHQYDTDPPQGWTPYTNICFVDGHIKSYARNDKDLKTLIWRP